MAVIVNQRGLLFQPYIYETEQELERDIVAQADRIFGPSSIYIDVKKRVKGNNIVTIPDGYVIDMADPDDPKLFVVENEIASHDPFRHIGIQMLKFVTSFDDAQRSIRNFVLEEISREPEKIRRLEEGAEKSGSRNIDAYLDKGVYGEFRGLVLIDEAREELHQVLMRINANISVLEFKSYVAPDGSRLFEFDTLYDEFEKPEEAEESGRSTDPSAVAFRRQRRAKADTIVVPAREDGFKEVFLGQDQWYAVRIGAAMKDKLRYIAAYQVAPVSAVTHIAEIKEIRPYKDTGKYQLLFAGPAEQIGPIQLGEGKNSPQGPVYVRREALLQAKTLEEALRS